MTTIRKWLSRRIELSLSWGELLVIVLLVVLINAVWPGVPTWFFLIVGAVMPTAQRAACSFGRWLRRRRSTA